ncbi:MAG: hypothetical protein K8953_04770, partial [Proteobacteria bacterium]|nr:hypothetical protein [Pseudomonadota bacterium]
VSFGYITANALFAAGTRHRGQPLTLNSSGLGSVYYRSGYTLWERDTIRYYYAGLSHDANVGLTIHPSRTGEAVWNGGFRALRNGETNANVHDREFDTNQNLTLTIDFGRKKVTGTVRNGQTNGTSAGTGNLESGKFEIRGQWDAVGVLTGSVDHTHVTFSGTGRLTGIIGERGVIGAFISGQTDQFGYAGGFYACPVPAAGTVAGDGLGNERCPSQ